MIISVSHRLKRFEMTLALQHRVDIRSRVKYNCIIDAWINYIHQMTWLQYPIITAKQKNMTSSSWDTIVLTTVQDTLHLYLDFE